MAGIAGLAQPRPGPNWMPGAGGMCLHTILLDPARPGPHHDRDLGGGRVPQRRRRRDLDAGNKGLRVRADPGPDRGGRPLRASHRFPPVAARHAVHAEALGRDASDDAGDKLARGQRRPADAISVSRSPCTHTSPIPCTWCRSRATRSTTRRTASCASIAAGRAATSGRSSRKGLPKKDCYVNVLRDAMAVDTLDPCGVYFGTTGGQVYASADAGDNWEPIAQRPARRAVRRGADALMVRVVLPAPLGASRTSTPRRSSSTSRAGDAACRARCTRSTLPEAARHDARQATKKRRAYIRFFACKEDWSNASPDDPLPDLVASGEEPFLVIGAMSGG